VSRVARLPAGAFDRVYKKGRRVSHSSLVFLVSDPEAPEALIRLGVVVGRRVARDAVPRNRLKRILRESFRHLAGAHIPGPADCILLARGSATSLKTRAAADAVLRRLLSKL